MSELLSTKAEQYAKKAQDFPSIFGKVNLISIRENIGEILKLIGREGIFREYTLHDANHIDEMLKLVDRLIPPETANQLRIADWLMIVLSCYFHDLGMLVTKKEFENRNNCAEFVAFKKELLEGDKGKDYEDALKNLTQAECEEFLYQEFVRNYHANRISLWIKGQEAPQFGDAQAAVSTVKTLLSDLKQVFRDDLAKICLSHHEDDLFDLDKYKISRVYGDDPQGEANLHYAALILRTADVRQIQEKRVPTVLYKLIDPSNPKSQEEWAKQAGVRAIRPKSPRNDEESDTIEVHASFDEEGAYFGLLAYLEQYAGKELKRCHDWAVLAQKKGATFLFPWKQIDATQVEPRGFEGHIYNFELDKEKILKLLTGHMLYNDSRVAVREVLQNALDAVRFQKYLFPDETLGKVEVFWDSKARKLTIRDTGTGMTQETIEKYLLNIGSSFYQSETVLQKHGGFSAISRFGIGILSTFMIADEVQILTVHPEEEDARKLTLPSVVRSYLIKKIPKDSPDVRAIFPHGTEIILHVRRSANLKDVEALVRYWIVIPLCEVTCKIDDSKAVKIGFPNASAALDYYYKKGKRVQMVSVAEVRSQSVKGIDLAYVVAKSNFADVWDFERIIAMDYDEDFDEDSDTDEYLEEPPGLCVEGIRVRSEPAGYDNRNYAPWLFANLTGQNAPRTNVARTDIEQTPELEHAIFQIYSLLSKHIQSEFDRLRANNIGIVEAAWEAEYIISRGLESSKISSSRNMREAISNIKVIAIEDENSCHAISLKELESFERVWTVDSRLFWNLEEICGILGIDQPAIKIIENLDRIIQPEIPSPRILGKSSRSLSNREISKMRVCQEERSCRIDICWEKEKGRWFKLPEITDIFDGIDESIYITCDEEVSSECQNYDVIFRGRNMYILATPPIKDLLNILGMKENFYHWLKVLIKSGKIPSEMHPNFKQDLTEANYPDCEDLLGRLKLPFERRFGYNQSRDERVCHLFSMGESS